MKCIMIGRVKILLNEHALVSIVSWLLLAPNLSSLSCQNRALYKLRVAFCKPAHAARQELTHQCLPCVHCKEEFIVMEVLVYFQ